MNLLTLPRSEFKRLTSSFDSVKTVIGLALIPLLYAGVYLYANWDPYGNLDQVDAALVNLDEGAEFDGEHRNLGSEVTEDLLEDSSFGWEEVSDRASAEQSTMTGDHEFALIIPEDFSGALSSPADFESAERAQLEIVTNEANNYLLSSIVEALAGELHESVSEQVGQETADQMLTGFGQIHRQLLDAADGAGEIRDGSAELDEGIGELTDGARTLSDGAGELDDGVGELQSGMLTLREGSGALEEGADELKDGAASLQSGLIDLESGGSELQDGADALTSGAEELEEGLTELSTGAEQVAQGNERLSEASHEAADVLNDVESEAEDRAEQSTQALIDAGVITEDQSQEAAEAVTSALADTDLAERAETAHNQLTEAQEAIDELAEGSREVADGASELESGSSALTSGASSLSENLPELTDGLAEARAGADSLHEGAGELADGAADLDAGAGELQEGAEELKEGTESLDDGTADLVDSLVEAGEGSSELTEGSSELASELSSGADEVPNPDEQERNELSEVIGNPLNVTQEAQAEAGSYGAGMAPFFMGLALWIGTLVMLQVLRPVSARALASNASSWAVAVGSWLPFLLLSAVQSLLLYAVALGVGLDPAHPWLTLLMLLAASAAFSALIQGVVTLLGNPGKFVIIVLLVLQLVASGGMFPSQTLPGAMEPLHPFLPLSHVVAGLRHVTYGADLGMLTGALGALGLTTLLGLAVLVLAVRRHRMWTLDRLKPPIEESA